MNTNRGIFKLRTDLHAATGQPAPATKAKSLSRRHYDYGQPLALQTGLNNRRSGTSRPFSTAPPPASAYEATVEPFGNARPLQNPSLIINSAEKQTYHPGLQISGENGGLENIRAIQPESMNAPSTIVRAPALESPSSSSGFDFDQADKTVFSGAQTVPAANNPDFDSFERELAHLLSGNVPERVAQKVEEIDRRSISTNPPPNPAPTVAEPAPPAPPVNPHDIFDQITASRLQSRVFDLGAFEVQKQKLDNFDHLLEKQQLSGKHKSTLIVPPANLIEIPLTVAMSELDLAEDFHRMGISGKEPDTAPTSPTIAPTSAPICEPAENIAESEAPEPPPAEPEINEPNTHTPTKS